MEKAIRLCVIGPSSRLSAFVDFDGDTVGITTDRTVFDVLLKATFADIDWDHDLFATRIADVSCFFVHVRFELTRGYFKTCSGLRQKSQLAFKTKGILANPTTMIARF
jgi:hypothetical protein